MAYSSEVSGTIILISAPSYRALLFLWLTLLQLCTERGNVSAKQISIRVKSSSCLVHSSPICNRCYSKMQSQALRLSTSSSCWLWSPRNGSTACRRTRRRNSQLHNDRPLFPWWQIWGQLWQMILVTARWKQAADRFMLTEQVRRFSCRSLLPDGPLLWILYQVPVEGRKKPLEIISAGSWSVSALLSAAFYSGYDSSW